MKSALRSAAPLGLVLAACGAQPPTGVCDAAPIASVTPIPAATPSSASSAGPEAPPSVQGVVLAHEGAPGGTEYTLTAAPGKKYFATIGEAGDWRQTTELHVDTVGTGMFKDLDDDTLLDLILDRGALPDGEPRFLVFPAKMDPPFQGVPHYLADAEPYSWRYTMHARNLDDALSMLEAAKGYVSTAEACGAVERASLVEHWMSLGGVWSPEPKKKVGWTCTGRAPEDEGWRPEIQCSTYLPACEATHVSGGRFGTTFPDERTLYFARENGKLTLTLVTAIAH